MNITNRTTKLLTCITHPTSFAQSGTDYILWALFRPGQSLSQPKQHQHGDVRLTVVEGEVKTGVPATSWKGRALISYGGPYKNTHSYLLVGDGRTVVDWTTVRNTRIPADASRAGADPATDAAVDQGRAATAAVFSALSTGFSATGIPGAIPAGFFSLVASMLLLGEDAPPEPPDIDEIGKKVAEVVTSAITEAQERTDADKATTTFLRAQKWLLTESQSFQSIRKGKGAPQGDDQDLDQTADGFLGELFGWGAPDRDLTFYIDHIRRRPETAKWMIPAFIGGISAYLQIRRLYVLAFKQPLSAATIEGYRGEVTSCMGALIATSDAWHRHCDDILKNDKIYGTPEGDQVKHALTRAAAGTDEIGPTPPPSGDPLGIPRETWEQVDSTPIGQALWNLKQVEKYLAEDLAALKATKPPRHFWKESWNRAELNKSAHQQVSGK